MDIICLFPDICNPKFKPCGTCRRYQQGILKPEFPVPALRIEVIPLVVDDMVTAIDIVDKGDKTAWPILQTWYRL